MNNRLRELRKSKGLTIRELGEKTRISYPIISYIENGERPFTQQNLETLCNFFEVSADYMLGHSIPNNERKYKNYFELHDCVDHLSEDQAKAILSLIKTYETEEK